MCNGYFMEKSNFKLHQQPKIEHKIKYTPDQKYSFWSYQLLLFEKDWEDGTTTIKLTQRGLIQYTKKNKLQTVYLFQKIRHLE